MNRSRRQFLKKFGAAIAAGVVAPKVLMEALRVPSDHVVVPGPAVPVTWSSEILEAPPLTEEMLTAAFQRYFNFSCSPPRLDCVITDLDTFNRVRNFQALDWLDKVTQL